MYTQVHLHPRLHPYPHITHASVCEHCMTYLLLSFDSCHRKRACMCTQTNTHANTHLRQSLSQGRMCAHAPPRTHARTHAQCVETLLSHQLWHESASSPGSLDECTNCSTCQLAKTLQHKHERVEGQRESAEPFRSGAKTKNRQTHVSTCQHTFSMRARARPARRKSHIAVT